LNQPVITHKYIWLDLVRAIAALEVFFGHLRALVFKNYWVGPTGFVKKVFYFFTGFSHEAVIIFFILSGFFITGAIMKARKAGKFSYLNYGLDRLVRLWIVLIPGLILTLIVDRLGLHYFGSNPAYTGTLEYTGNIHVDANLNIGTFIGNIFFLQTILVNTFGSNAPLWSLSNEFWYYVLFPVVLSAFYSKKMIAKVLFFILAVGICLFIGNKILLYFLIWLIGSALYFVQSNFPAPTNRLRNLIFVFGFTTFIIFFYLLRTTGSVNWGMEFVSGILTGILCYCGLYSSLRSVTGSRIISFFSGFSYSLYIIHLPICIFITSFLVGPLKDWSISSLLLYLFIVVIILGVTIIFWYLFESRYKQVRNYIKKRLSGTVNPAFLKN
jgi:peptidoglycan/LPS O-acetylase OafA/YrhL